MLGERANLIFAPAKPNIMKIIADQDIPYLKGILEPYANVNYLPSTAISPETVRDADAMLVRTRTRCNRFLLQGSHVAFIGSATTGTDHLDHDFLKQAGINYVHAPGGNAMSVVQYVLAVLFEISIKYQSSLKGKTLGIIGAGTIGSRVGRFARLIGMRVLYYDPPREEKEGAEGFVPLDKLRTEADFITLHVPLNTTKPHSTLHIIDSSFLARMKPGAFLINAARGPVVDNLALLNALKNEQVQGAALDCWENEPDISMELLDYIDIATPHIAGYSRDGKANATARIVQELAAWFGLPLQHWYPENLEAPSAPEIEIPQGANTTEARIRHAVLHTYSVASDDYRLRSHPGSFEQLRNNYPNRREFNAYSITGQVDEKSAEILERLGFSVTSTVHHHH